MQHKVPQFIEVEDKIFGPFTLKQFSYLAGGFGLCIILWRTFSESSFLILILAPVIGLTLALTFLKPNGKPFIFLVQNFLTFLIKPKKLFWKNPGIDESRENVLTFQKEKEKVERKQQKFEQKLFTSGQIEKLSKNLDKQAQSE
jgi:hypothetical protein